jgi:hypothetical protein
MDFEVSFVIPHGFTPLHHAAVRGDLERTKALLDAGHAIDPKDALGRTPLWWASNLLHAKVMRLLRRAGADVCTVDNNGKSAAKAATERLFRTVRLFAEGADVRAVDAQAAGDDKAAEEAKASGEGFRLLIQMMHLPEEAADADDADDA